MKFLVLSDNHGNWSLVNDIITNYRPKVDYIFHCGDSEFPADDPIWEPVDAVVSGNMDFDPQYRRRDIIETPVGSVLLVHGHLDAVNHGNQQLLTEAQEAHCTFVFHGHTHQLYAEKYGDILIANPGSLSRSRGSYAGTTYLFVNVVPEEIIVEFYDEKMNLIPQLCKTFAR